MDKVAIEPTGQSGNGQSGNRALDIAISIHTLSLKSAGSLVANLT